MNRDLDIALEAARAGAEKIKSYQNHELDVREKGNHDLVTNADIETEQVIVNFLKDHFPDDKILAEESENEDYLSAGRTWIIDPIDGTTNFANNFPVFCVSVALWENKKPKAGVVIEVNRNEEFTAAAGEGAWLNGEKISVSRTENPRNAFVGTGFPYDDLTLINSYLDLLRFLMRELQGIRRPGSACFDLCCVACGRYDGFFEYSLHAWDVAAASLIIEEAGGVLTDWNGDDGWLFGQRMVAGNIHIHDYLLQQIKEFIPEEKRKNIVPA
ncbi:MAG: inositol monophosphatase family protein [Balneolaceae bacterium]